LHVHHVDIIALQELNLDTTQFQVRQQIFLVLRETFGSVKMITASTPVTKANTSKPGGVLLAIVGSCSHRVTTTHRDPFGRWCSATLAGRNQQDIRIYSAYQCVDDDIRYTGTNTYYAQLWRLFRDKDHRYPQPRRRFIKDLHAELLALKHDGISLIVLGDFNETIGTSPALMASICSSIGLSDAIEHMHPQSENIPTYIRGRRRLDYGLLSHSLLPAITASGLNQFHEISSSDHRALFIDLQLSHMFHATTPIVNAQLRHINSDSSAAKAFVKHAYEHLLLNDVFLKYSSFVEQVDHSPTPHLLANAIDDQITRSLLSAEKKIARPPRPPWSEKLHKASQQVRLWKMAKSGNLNELDIATQLASAAADADFHDVLPTRLSDINEHLLKAHKLLRTIRANADAERQAFLQVLKERTALRKQPKDTDAAQALLCIERQIHSRQQFIKIRNIMEPTNQQSLTKILVSRTEVFLHPRTRQQVNRETTALVDTRAELEAAILSRNQQHFAKAQGTPFTIPPLNEMGSHQHFDVLQATADQPFDLPPGSFKETAEVLAVLRDAANHPPPPWTGTINLDDFIKGLLRWRESTSTSPSGRHLGIYKTLVTVHINSSGEFTDGSEDEMPSTFKAARILGLIHGLATAAARLGFYLRRWTKVINVMIYKEPGNYNLDKLRVIHLFEADFNLIVGILFGRRAMHHANNNNLLHDGQGGRLGSECMDVTFTKILHITMSHLTKTPLGLFESDAEACFDRIVMLMAFLAFKSLGAPAKPLQMWEQTLYHVRHVLRTGFGESEHFYDYSATCPIIGPGQGSRGGVAAVSAMTTILLRAFDRIGHGSTFCDPPQSIFYAAISKMFIDDASNFVNNFVQWLHTSADQGDVTALLQQDAQSWERLLHTSGGKLRPDKCLYYILHWLFDAEGRASPSLPDDDLLLTLSTGTSEDDHTIRHVPHHCAHKTLGVYLSTDFQTSTALSILQHKVLHYTSRLLKGNLSKHETWIGYFACFLPKLTYGLSVMTHSRDDLLLLQRPAVSATLLQLGFRRTINRSIVFGSPRYGGLGLRDLYLEQGIAQLQLFIRHLRAQSPQGKLLQIALSWMQLQAGISWDPLRFPHRPLPHIPVTWLTSVRDFLRTIDGSLTIAVESTETVPSPARILDRYIMEAILDLPKVSAKDLQACNRVRLFLGVTLLSEITTADGAFLATDAWRGTRPRHSPLLWPYQPSPGPSSFRTWQQMLSRAFMTDGRLPNFSNPHPKLPLHTPLGTWLEGSKWLQSKWSTFYCYGDHKLYWQDELDHFRFSTHSFLQRSRLRNPKFETDPTQTQVPLPFEAIPVDAVFQFSHIMFPSIARLQGSNLPRVQPRRRRRTFRQYIDQLPSWDRLLLHDHRFGDTPTTDILDLLRNPDTQLILSSDGGARDRCGSFGAVIASQSDHVAPNGAILMEVGGVAFGDTPRSFRAESYGQLAALRLLLHLTIYYRVRPLCRVLFLLDNQGRLTRTRRFVQQPKPMPRIFLSADFDIDMQIRDTLTELRIRTSDEHIHSHQADDPTTLEDQSIPWKTQLNFRCDALATDHLQQQSKPTLLVPFLPGSRVTLSIKARTITSKLPAQIRHIGGSSLPYTNHRSQVQHMCRIHAWSTAQFHSVDWTLFHSITNVKSSFPNRLFTIRWVNHILPLLQRQFRFGLSPLAACPSDCGCLAETESHLLRCSHPDRGALHTSSSIAIRSLCQRHKADPWLRQILFSIISNFDPTVTFNLTTLTQPYRDLIRAQAALGANALFYGFFHHSWVDLQHDYLGRLGLPRDRNQARHLFDLLGHHFQSVARGQWTLRNSHLHDSTAGTIPYARTLLLAEVRHIYSASDLLLFHDRDAVYQSISLEDRLDFSDQRLKRWITHITPILKISIRQAHDRPPGNRDIRDFFAFGRPPEGGPT
jgi:hypothetical protein